MGFLPIAPTDGLYYRVLSVLFMKDFDQHCAIALREAWEQMNVPLQLSSIYDGAQKLIERLGVR